MREREGGGITARRERALSARGRASGDFWGRGGPVSYISNRCPRWKGNGRPRDLHLEKCSIDDSAFGRKKEECRWSLGGGERRRALLQKKCFGDRRERVP